MHDGTEGFKDFKIQTFFRVELHVLACQRKPLSSSSQQKDRLVDFFCLEQLKARSHIEACRDVNPSSAPWQAFQGYSHPIFALTILISNMNNHQLETYLAKHEDLHGFTLELEIEHDRSLY